MVCWCEYKLMGAQQPGLPLASRANMLGLLGKYLCSRGPMFSVRDPGFNLMLTHINAGIMFMFMIFILSVTVSKTTALALCLF